MLDENFKVLSALAAYIKQLGILEKLDLADFINQNKSLSSKLIHNFENRFNPEVQAPAFEAIHLRNGKIARGGIRWSDRKEDFRTEVLDLVKTQNTKNSIIVPVGSKGGFVITHYTKGLPKEEYIELAKSHYRSFLEGCLDITDNVIDGKIVRPKNVISYDEEDPYLVVAADKGTATFSDIANTISKEYNFWMGDAFASGGSNGYDHKRRMGMRKKALS
jgi:glutamate dehydrogenase